VATKEPHTGSTYDVTTEMEQRVQLPDPTALEEQGPLHQRRHHPAAAAETRLLVPGEHQGQRRASHAERDRQFRYLNETAKRL